MKALKPNWITEGRIDFEYKKYILLAYLQEVSKQFNENKLYPFLSDLIYHYHQTIAFQKQKKEVENHFPKKLSKIDLQSFTLHYEKMMQDEDYMNEIESILEYAIPKLESHLQEGRQIYDFIESHLYFQPIGVQPLDTSEGYLMVKASPDSDTEVFLYRTSLFESAAETFRGLKTHFIMTYHKGLLHTFEAVKSDLIKQIKTLPNPAVFAAETTMAFPFRESVLPVAKRILMRTLTQKAA